MNTSKSMLDLLKGYHSGCTQSESAEKQRLPQPPLERSRGGKTIRLSRDFEAAARCSNVLELLNGRRSVRRYASAPLSLIELSFLLWYTQGTEKVVGNQRKAAIRTVPSAGARHPFECYLALLNVEGLEPGLYHYLSLSHELEFVKSVDNLGDRLTEVSSGQSFLSLAAAVFIWAAVPERTIWRYPDQAEKYILLDAGHVCQNFYLASGIIGCGACAIGAYDQDLADALIGVDGQEELTVYMAAVGKKEEG